MCTNDIGKLNTMSTNDIGKLNTMSTNDIGKLNTICTNDIGISWNKAIRKVWKLTPTAHTCFFVAIKWAIAYS